MSKRRLRKALNQIIAASHAIPGTEELRRIASLALCGCDSTWHQLSPSELIGPTVCVVCWHDGHPDDKCMEPEETAIGTSICGCTEYVTKNQRGEIVMAVSERGDTLRAAVAAAEAELAAAEREEKRHPTDLRRRLYEARVALRNAVADLTVFEVASSPPGGPDATASETDPGTP